MFLKSSLSAVQVIHNAMDSQSEMEIGPLELFRSDQSLNYYRESFFNGAQAGGWGEPWICWFSFMFLLKSSTLDHSATAPSLSRVFEA